VSTYEKAAHQRLTLLKKSQDQNLSWLSALEKIMAQQNVKISAARVELTRRLHLGQKRHIPLFPQFICKMSGGVESAIGEFKERAEQAFAEKLAQNRAVDRAAGMTTFGCHRSDFEVIHKLNCRPAKECSTGEQKIMLISVILSFVYQRIESLDRLLLLLLDDVIARLDYVHRLVLFEQIEHLSNANVDSALVQTFFSGTDADMFEPMKKAQHFEVKDSVVLPSTRN
jgi:DNA replication and repair protein RecF